MAAPQEGLPIVNGKRAGSSTRTELVDIEWVAKRLGVTVRHIRRLVAEKRIPIVKWGHLVRFDPQEIELWIDDARRPRSG
jgi:excisionase family DNA binding protein